MRCGMRQRERGEGKGRLELRGALLGFPQPFCARLLTQQPCLLSSVAHA